MTTETLYDLMDLVIRFTIFGVCACFLAIGVLQIWKWMIELMISFVTYLFPGLGEPEDDEEETR